MSKERDRAPLSTEISPRETEIDPHPFDRGCSTRPDDEGVRGSSNAVAGTECRAQQWLEKAMRLHDSGLASLKADQLLDPLRDEPRFQAIQHALKFPP
jgi:hypothetical protein